jgi:hypothetical protein
MPAAGAPPDSTAQQPASQQQQAPILRKHDFAGGTR